MQLYRPAWASAFKQTPRGSDAWASEISLGKQSLRKQSCGGWLVVGTLAGPPPGKWPCPELTAMLCGGNQGKMQAGQLPFRSEI